MINPTKHRAVHAISAGRIAIRAVLLGVSAATLQAAPLSLTQVNSDNGLPARSVQWTDASGQPRKAIMVDQRAGGAGYLRQLTYKTAEGDRVCTGTGDNGHMGDGYVQNHTGFGGDSSSHGVAGTTAITLSGPHHVLITYSMPGYTISGQSVPTTVQWFFADGRSHPIFALTQDARGAAGNIGADSRSPYGDVAYDGGAGDQVGGASFGDTYKFATLAAKQVTANSGWRYNEPNTIPYAMQWTAVKDAEMGHVATAPITIQDAGSDTRTSPPLDLRGTQALNGPMINDENWAYQILNYVLPGDGSPTWSKRLTWGTQWGLPGGFDNYGAKGLSIRQYSRHSDSHNGRFNGTREDGMLMSYSVFVVLGTHAGGYKDGTVGQAVKQMENAAAATLSAVTGTVRTSGPKGVGNAENVTAPYIPAGYNRTYATWEVDAAGNAVDATLTPAAGQPLDHPIFVVNNYTAAQLPANISVGAGLATPEADYFATLDTAKQRIWITVNRSSAGPINLKVGAGGGGQPQAPAIAAAPASASIGSTIIITGLNFGGANAVKFNGLNATFNIDSATQISAVVPAGATTGPITVTTPAGTAASPGNFAPIAAPAQGTTSVYGDELQNAENWSWATVDMANGAPVHSGTKSIKVNAGGFEAFRVHFNAPLDPASFTGLSFWIHGGTAGGQPLLIQSTINDVAQTGFNLPAPVANTWQKYTVTMANLGLVGKPNFDGFWIQNNSGAVIPAFYIDDIDLLSAAAPQPPTISGFNPSSGIAGSSVTITGERFTGASAVKFNGVSAAFTVNSATQISAVVPAGAAAGPISVTTADGTATSAASFTPILPPQPPTINSFDPASGIEGSRVTIAGARFTGATALKFNGVDAAFTVNSASEIAATVPAGATPGPISVTTPDGTATSAASFTVVVAPPPGGQTIYDDLLHDAEDWSWAVVDLNNGAPVHSGIKSAKVTADSYEAFRVHFNAPVTPASYTGLSFWINGGTTGAQPLLIQATINDVAQSAVTLPAPPANAWQKYTVSMADLGLVGKPNFDGFWIQNNSGQTISPFYIDDIEFVTAAPQPEPPTITAINPTSGRPGDLVVITGQKVGGATQVKFNGTTAAFIGDAANQVSATVPDGATTGPITVTTADGTATSPMVFTVQIPPNAPAITSITPNTGTAGDTVTIRGNDLSGATEVKFNGVNAVFIMNSPTELGAQVPAGATTGQITVTTPGGTAASEVFTVKSPQPGGAGGFKQMDTDDGGWFTGFAIHPAGRLYGRTDIGGLYRSDDHGDSWQFLSGDMTTVASLAVQGVAVAAADPNTVYQCVGVSYANPADQGIWKSTDGGATWRLLKAGIRFSGNDAERWGGECIAIRPGNDSEVWAGSRGDGLWRSRDAGNSWQQLGAGTLAGAQFVSISLPPAGRSDIWVGASGFGGPGGLWVSVDEGASWTAVSGVQNLVPAPSGVWRIVREPNGKVLIAGGNASGTALYEFNAANWNLPGTYTWRDISWPGIDRSEAAPLVAALVDGRIVAGSIFGGFNGGPNSLRTQIRSLAETWSPTDSLTGAMPAWQRNPAPTLIEGSRNALVQDPSNPNRWFMAGGYGPFRTVNNGATWQYIVNGVDEVTDYKVNFHPTDPNRVYLPMADHGGAVVLDGGESGATSRYISTPKAYPDDLALTHAILASGDRLIALGGDERSHNGNPDDDFHPRIFKSLNNGLTWNVLAPAGLPDEAKRCIITAVASRDNPDDMLLALAGTDNGAKGGVYRSTDGGNTWVRTTGLPVGADYGDQFSPNADLEVDAVDNNLRYVFLKNRGLYKSTNRGVSWSLVNTGLANYGVAAADRLAGGHVWVGVCCGQPVALGRSTDGGSNWSPVAGFSSVTDVDAAGDRVAVLGQRAGDSFNKIYYSADAGATWTEITRAGYRFGNAQAVAVDPWRPGTVWISTNGRSVARYTPGEVAPPTVTITVKANAEGPAFIVDGVTYTTAQTFNWPQGSSHNLEVTTSQEIAPDTRYIWSAWSDGGASSHTVTPIADATYTANFTTEYQLQTSVNPANSATVTANPAGPWYPAGTTVSLQATLQPGFFVQSWSNAEAGNNDTARVVMAGPRVVTVTLAAAQALSIEGQGVTPGGEYHFGFSGRADRVYRVESTVDFQVWTLVQTYANPAGPISFSDPTSPGQAHRFYRVVEVAP